MIRFDNNPVVKIEELLTTNGQKDARLFDMLNQLYLRNQFEKCQLFQQFYIKKMQEKQSILQKSKEIPLKFSSANNTSSDFYHQQSLSKLTNPSLNANSISKQSQYKSNQTVHSVYLNNQSRLDTAIGTKLTIVSNNNLSKVSNEMYDTENFITNKVKIMNTQMLETHDNPYKQVQYETNIPSFNEATPDFKTNKSSLPQIPSSKYSKFCQEDQVRAQNANTKIRTKIQTSIKHNQPNKKLVDILRNQNNAALNLNK
ncbi:UNKNOWN [Stylonychia lemnae]|uniref:Uncharacterized protein n=1 Tax=Stylonychia lemnae TaxID=5949 RepID=A0A078A5V6_STYLE|nr:UNKNOWN [Stylonychia lemnae]|eukprot:CDW77630.1 UNKNOWN [Stylonychia lemnae]